MHTKWNVCSLLNKGPHNLKITCIHAKMTIKKEHFDLKRNILSEKGTKAGTKKDPSNC